jgi:nicotinamide-nucleotide amidase
VGVATTGVAGPGGMNDKVVGTIIWAVATAEGVRSWERELPGDREAVRQRLATAALEGLRRA